MKVTIINKGKASRGIYALSGVEFVRPGKQRTLEIDGSTLEDIEAMPSISVEQKGGTTGEQLEITPDADPATLIADMTDAEIRAEIERMTGKKPHHKAKRETLAAQLAEALNG